MKFSRSKATKQVAAQTRTQTTAPTMAAAQAVVKLQAVARGHSSRKLVNGVREAVAAETLVAMNLVRCLRASRLAWLRFRALTPSARHALPLLRSLAPSSSTSTRSPRCARGSRGRWRERRCQRRR